jgi:hypothetical protein
MECNHVSQLGDSDALIGVGIMNDLGRLPFGRKIGPLTRQVLLTFYKLKGFLLLRNAEIRRPK